jgi:hypothetical protein
LRKESNLLKNLSIVKPIENSLNSLPNKEAELIIREAELKALEILERTKAENNRLKEDVISLKQHKLSLIKKIKHILTTQIDLIDVLNIDEQDREEFKNISDNVKQNKNADNAAEIINKNDQDLVNLDLSQLKSSTNNETDSIPFIKQKAQEILNAKQESDVLPKQIIDLESEKPSFDINNFLK